MTNVVPVFPNGLFQWTDRIDEVNIDFAEDINSVASDLISVENTLGTNPQIEKNSPNGSPPVTYGDVDDRISDAMNNALVPVCILRSAPFAVNNTLAGVTTPFNLVYDPYNMYNGTDLTINVNGWFMFTVHQTWSWWNDGYSHTYLTTSGNNVDEDLIDWTFAGNVQGSGGGVIGPNGQTTTRWQQFGNRPRIAHISWQGRCTPGERVSVLAENGTSNASLQVTYTAFKVSMIKTLSSSLSSNIQ